MLFSQNLISAATGVNLTTVDDPVQRRFLPSFLRGIAEENKLVTSPNFVVTQALVALLADKGAKLRPNYDKAEMEKRGMRGLLVYLSGVFNTFQGVAHSCATFMLQVLWNWPMH